MYFDPANSRSSVGSGNTIYDLTGNSNTCTFSATPTYDVASKGNLLLAGYGTVAHTSTLWGSNQFTLSVWAKRTSGTSGIMISKDTNYIDHEYNGKTLASFYATAAYYPRQYLVSGISTSRNNEWRHFTSTYDGTVGSLYENGALIGTTNMSISLNNTTDPLYIGQLNGGGYNFNGKLGTMMTYNRALSAQEVKQNYDATKGRYITLANTITSGLILNYDISDYRSAPFTGTSIYDLSGFGNTGTLTNGPTYSGLNDGCLVFDGSNDNIPFTISNFNNILTIEIWMKMKAFSAGHMPFGFYAYDVFAYQGALGFNTSIGDLYGLTSTQVTNLNLLNQWKHYIFEMRSDVVYTNNKIYVNGQIQTLSQVLGGGESISFRTFGNGSGKISGWLQNNNWHQPMDLSQFKIYNRALTAQEILQNFNALRGRYGV
jgi:hypothetical protein